MRPVAAEQQCLPESFVVAYGTARSGYISATKKNIFSSVNTFNSALSYTQFSNMHVG